MAPAPRGRRDCSFPHDTSPGYDDPVNIDGEPDDMPRFLMADEVKLGADDVTEPVLDD